MSVLQRIPWGSVLRSTGVVALGYTLYALFVRPFLHPLRKIPGLPYRPLIGNIREITSGQAMESSIKMVEEYGTIVRYYFFFGSERLLIACPETMKHILVTNCKNYIKPPDRIKLMRLVLGEGLVILEGAEHAAHKRLMAPSFSKASIKGMIPVFEDVANKLGEYWLNTCLKDCSNGTAQVQADLARTTLDVIGRTAFGYDFNSVLDPKDPISQAFRDLLSGAGLSWRVIIPFWEKLPFPDSIRLRRNVRLMNNKVMEVIRHKRTQIEEGKDVCGDILGVMMMAKDSSTGEGLTDKELQDEVKTLMSAGHETTASAMSWFLLTMAQHPDIQERCRQEVLAHVPDNDKPVGDELEQLTYLGNTIKETLRMFSVVPLTLRQALHDDTYQGKYYIPAGTIVLLSMGPMMRSAEHFKDPNTFNPDRFNDLDANSIMYTFLPFLVGPRMCLGYKFALIEMKVVLATLLRKFSFEMVPDTSYKRRSGITMRPFPSMELKISKVVQK